MEHTSIRKRGARPGPAEYFTGGVLIEELIASPEPARANLLRVHFHPGARTFWHTHELGQGLYVIDGLGLIARRGEAPRYLHPGDTVWIPPGVEHWHGATPGHAMTHLAMQERGADGMPTAWLEGVSEADYTAPPEG